MNLLIIISNHSQIVGPILKEPCATTHLRVEGEYKFLMDAKAMVVATLAVGHNLP